MYSKFVKPVVRSPEEIYPTCLERSGMGKFSIPPTSKRVGWEKFLSHLPRWDRTLADTSLLSDADARARAGIGHTARPRPSQVAVADSPMVCDDSIMICQYGLGRDGRLASADRRLVCGAESRSGLLTVVTTSRSM